MHNFSTPSRTCTISYKMCIKKKNLAAMMIYVCIILYGRYLLCIIPTSSAQHKIYFHKRFTGSVNRFQLTLSPRVFRKFGISQKMSPILFVTILFLLLLILLYYEFHKITSILLYHSQISLKIVYSKQTRFLTENKF